MFDGFGWDVTHFVFVAFGVGVDQHFDAGEFIHQRLFDFVHDMVRRGDRHVGVDPDVKLAKVMRTA